MNDLLQMYAGLKAVLFDMDGVLTRNSTIHEAAWRDVVQQYFQVNLLEGDTRIHGGRAHEILSVLLQRPVSRAEALPFHRHKEERYRELARGHLEPTRGLLRYLDFLKSRNIATVLVTSGDRPNVDLVLEAFELQDTFPIQITGETVQNGKPHPEPYLKALEVLGITADQAIVHEDAPAGIRSGKGAGCRVLALPTTTHAAELLEAGADLVIEDFEVLLEQLHQTQNA
ncbi:HAD family hydrolase [Deinococcus roseus]|uniref:Hydrolase n=1 Tax=Deinococcus roseus TaxID=392414 RepID=A0ABQ2D0F6_9DEIO|nr:HAD family phosphatase [Deinococcus roseus]GGJ39171.1 hydrolase [Deinococcus roseus]